MSEELDKSPWGRRLHLLVHRLPRDSKDGADWELERGFHVQVVGADLFEIVLRPRGEAGSKTPGLLSDADGEGQVRFLLWHAPLAYRSERLGEFAEKLKSEYPAHVGLILSHLSERNRAFRDFVVQRRLWKEIHHPVLQIFQAYPNSDFFSLEKSLFDLGRVGRRLQKLTRLRRFLPW